MADTSSIEIHVSSAHGPPTSIAVSRRARELCPILRSLAPGSSLPTAFITPLRIVLSYLDGDIALVHFTSFNRDTSILLLFATTWSLAARLHLPDLQNLLVSAMAGIYAQCIQHHHEFPADDHVDHAFRHLRADVGPGSQAEALLICFIGRTAPMIPALIKQLKLYQFDKEISEKILVEARSFAPDPLQYNIPRFQVDIAYPPRYPPVQIQHASPLDDLFEFSPIPEKCPIQPLGCGAVAFKEESYAPHASYVPPYAETVSSHDTLFGLKTTPAEKMNASFEPQAFVPPSAKGMNFVGKLGPLEKLKYMDPAPGIPTQDLIVFPNETSDPLHPGSIPLPQVPNAAATAAANAALHPPPPPPPQSAAPAARATRDIWASLPVDLRCSVRIERADSVTEERIRPEVPTVEPQQLEVQAQPDVRAQPDSQARPVVQVQPEVQARSEAQGQSEVRAQTEVHAEPIVQTNEGDHERRVSPQQTSTRTEQRDTQANAEPASKRKSWLRHIFSRRPGTTTPAPSSSPPRRTTSRKPPPSTNSEGGTWAYVRTNNHHHCTTRPDSSGDYPRLPPPRPASSSSGPERRLALPSSPGEGDGNGGGNRGQNPPRPPPTSGGGSGQRPRRSLSACREDKGEVWFASKKKGSRTGFALMSFNRRVYDE